MARTMTAYVLGAVVISLLAGILGMITSFYWGTATGATIVLWAMGFSCCHWCSEGGDTA